MSPARMALSVQCELHIMSARQGKALNRSARERSGCERQLLRGMQTARSVVMRLIPRKTYGQTLWIDGRFEPCRRYYVGSNPSGIARL